jgi:hypothetical protein
MFDKATAYGAAVVSAGVITVVGATTANQHS